MCYELRTFSQCLADYLPLSHRFCQTAVDSSTSTVSFDRPDQYTTRNINVKTSPGMPHHAKIHLHTFDTGQRTQLAHTSPV